MKKLIAVLLLCPLFIISAEALEPELQDEISGLETALSDEERELSGELSTDGSYDPEAALRRIIKNIKDRFISAFKDETAVLGSVLSVIFLCALCASLSPGDKFASCIETAGCCAVSYMLSGSVEGMINQAASALNRLADYSGAALPVIFSAAAACGQLGSASVKYAASSFAMEVFIRAAQGLILPLIYAHLGVCLSSCIFDNAYLGAAAKLCRKLASLSMTVLCMLFCSYISLSGVIAGSTDALAVKTAKSVISGSLPVVGGIVSDAASVVLASAALIKNSAGIFSLIAVCTLCAGPFALLSLKAFIYKLVSAAAALLPGNKTAALLDGLGTTMTLLLGLVGSCGIMLFVSIVSGIKVISL